MTLDELVFAAADGDITRTNAILTMSAEFVYRWLILKGRLSQRAEAACSDSVLAEEDF